MRKFLICFIEALEVHSREMAKWHKMYMPGDQDNIQNRSKINTEYSVNGTTKVGVFFQEEYTEARDQVDLGKHWYFLLASMFLIGSSLCLHYFYFIF